MSYDHFTILLVHRLLLGRLDNDLTVHPWNDLKARTDLVLDNGVSNILREFAHSLNVCIIFPISDRVCSLRNGVYLVLDFFESPEIDGFGVEHRFLRMATYSSRTALRSDSSSPSMALLPKSSLLNLARVDSIFSFIPGVAYHKFSKWPATRSCLLTSRNFKNVSKETFV